MSRAELQTGYVLHTRPWRDNSLLVEFFSRQRGRVSLAAKGAKGRKTRGGPVAALLQPFGRLCCSWSGRGELKTLTACEPEAAPLALAGRRLFSALYVNELLVRLLHHEDPHEQLFDLYQQVLQALLGDASGERVGSAGNGSSNGELGDASGELVDSAGNGSSNGELGDASGERALRRFEFALLNALGYGFDLGVDGATGEPISPDRWYHYRQGYGLVLAGGDIGASAGATIDPAIDANTGTNINPNVDSNTGATINPAIDSNTGTAINPNTNPNTSQPQPRYLGRDLQCVQRGELDGPGRQCAKQLMREALASHLGGRPLKSRDLFRRMV